MLSAAMSGWAQHGTVVADSAGRTTAQATSPESGETKFEVPESTRRALLFTRYALDIKLNSDTATLHARAVVQVKNEAAQALSAVTLQISSSLAWEGIEADGKPLRFVHHTIANDADHTGTMQEALVTLPMPLAPGAARSLTIYYGGPIEPSAKRLEAIGTPADTAAHSDWDGAREDFVGLRGYGNVLWYPVSSVPVSLGDGDALFREIGRMKQRESAATVTMTVAYEFTGEPPTVAFLNGVLSPLKVTTAAAADVPGVAIARLDEQPLGFDSPSLFFARRTLESGNGMKLYAKRSDAAATQAYMTAASILTPQMNDWLGAKTRADLCVLELPSPSDSPVEEGTLLLTDVASVNPKQLEGPVSHSLAHAYFTSSRPWLNEGVAQFMASLWTEHQQGREAAITLLDNLRGALSLAETPEPDHDTGQPLPSAADPIFYRTKATYVLWMLRGIVGDRPLAAALEQYDPAADRAPGYFQSLLETSSHQKLDWFFRDWVDRDRGLPDLSIENVTSSRGSVVDAYIVAVTVANAGTAVADVPVTIYSADAKVTERMRIGPRASATHRFLVHGPPDQVEVNDGTTPETQASVHRRNVEFTQPK